MTDIAPRIEHQPLPNLVRRPVAENLVVPERVITAPVGGVFQPTPPDSFTTEGEIVHRGQIVGTIGDVPAAVSVLSPFTGFFMGLLAHAGERVRPGQPLAWVRVTA